MRRKKPNYSYNRYTLVSERGTGIRQWSFSRQRLVVLLGSAILIISGILFVSAEFLTESLYKVKVANLKKEYSELTNTLAGLQNQMEEISSDMNNLEDQDRALRTYAGMPQIDEDVRQVGVGGLKLAAAAESNEFFSNLEGRISAAEMDIDKLSRKVKLELKSYGDIYNRVQRNVDQLASIPSVSPVKEGYLNSRFGYRNDPFNGRSRFHYGQDFAVNTGTDVFAPADGVVKFVGREGGFGNVLKIDHGAGYRTIYAHLKNSYVKRGQTVKRGERVARSGNSGRSAGPHLHYEIHLYGRPQNPLNYIFTGFLK